MKSYVLIFTLVLTLSVGLFEFQESFAALPVATTPNLGDATSPAIGANTLTSAATFTVPAGTADKLLVFGIAMEQSTTNGGETVSAVDLTGCTGAAGATSFTKTMDTENADIRTEIWVLDDTPAMSVGTCSVRATLQGGESFGNLGLRTKAKFNISLFADVDGTNPVSLTAEATGATAASTVSLSTNEHNRVYNVSASTSAGAASTIEAGQTGPTELTKLTSAIAPTFSTGSSTAAGDADPAATSQGWNFNNVAGTWAISAIAIRSTSDDGITADNPASSAGGGGSNGACSGDCTPPTLGVNEEGQRLVEGGFTYNGQTVDSELFYTPFPLITTTVGEQNIGIFKIFENQGLDKIVHLELVFGLRAGERIDDSLAKIIWDKSWDGKESIILDDPQNVFSDVKLNFTTDKCRSDSSLDDDCLVVAVEHTFRKPLNFDIVGTSVWDTSRNQWSNYFNHGVRITGESLDPAPTTTVAFGTNQMRGLYDLTQIDSKTDTWLDEFGNVYKNNGNNFFEKISVLKQNAVTDYLESRQLESADTINSELFDFMSSYYKTSLDLSDSFSGINDIKTMEISENYYDLRNADLMQAVNIENARAEITMQQKCVKCSELNFAEINNVQSHDSSDQFSKTQDPLNKKIMQEEYLKSVETFNKFYGYIYNDELILLEPAKITYDTNVHVDKNTIIENEQSRAQKTALAMYGTITDSD